MEYEYGICTLCGNECNASSQSCGRCARQITGHALGWNKLPGYIEKSMFTLENYKGKILYNNEYMDEYHFRKMIYERFCDTCPFNSRNCSLNLIVIWVGAKFTAE